MSLNLSDSYKIAPPLVAATCSTAVPVGGCGIPLLVFEGVQGQDLMLFFFFTTHGTKEQIWSVVEEIHASFRISGSTGLKSSSCPVLDIDCRRLLLWRVSAQKVECTPNTKSRESMLSGITN